VLNTTEGEDHNFNLIKYENIDQSSSSDHKIGKLHHTHHTQVMVPANCKL